MENRLIVPDWSNSESTPMSAARVVKFCHSCCIGDCRYQIVELSDGKYALVIGPIRLVLRLPLPIDYDDDVRIAICVDLSELWDAWDKCSADLENSGDHALAEQMREEWTAWAESAVAN